MSCNTGRFIMAKRLGKVGEGSSVFATTTDGDDNIVITGGVTGAADMNGDGDTTDGGAESASGYGNTDAYISVFNSSGTWQWAKRLGGASLDEVWDVTTDSNNNVIVTGFVNGAADMNGDGDTTDGGAETPITGNAGIFISVFNSAGTWQWAKRIEASQFGFGQGIATDSDNNVIVIAYGRGAADMNGDGDMTDGGAESATGYGNNDVLISAFNSAGTWQWAKRLGKTESDSGSSVTTDSNNNIIVTGNVRGAADMNGDGDSTDGGAESIS